MGAAGNQENLAYYYCCCLTGVVCFGGGGGALLVFLGGNLLYLEVFRFLTCSKGQGSPLPAQGNLHPHQPKQNSKWPASALQLTKSPVSSSWGYLGSLRPAKQRHPLKSRTLGLGRAAPGRAPPPGVLAWLNRLRSAP